MTMTNGLAVSSTGSVALSFVLCLTAAPIVLWGLRRWQIVDVPSARSAHQASTPRGGGLAPAVACLLVVAGAVTGIRGDSRAAIVFLAGGMGLLGLIDDVLRVSPLPRLVGQTVVAGTGLVWLGQDIHGSVGWHLLSLLVVAAWVVAYVNAFNFMDGINGISVIQVIAAGTVWWVLGETQHVPALATAGLIAAGAAAAFAPFNTPRATMFLGDVGSYFFGAWLATAAVFGVRAKIPPEAVLAPLSVYGADTFVTFVRRIRRGETWYLPHRGHTYQHLVQRGWSHARTSLIVAVAIVVTSAAGALSLTGSMVARVAGDSLLLVALAGYVTLPNMLAHRAVRGSGAAHRT